MEKASREEVLSSLRILLATTVGCLVSALGTNLFYRPAHLLSGGFTGLSLLLNYHFGWNTSLIYFIINIPLFFLVWFKIGKKSFFYCLYGTVIFSLALELLNFSIPYESELTTVILGGALNGAGVGLMLRYGGMAGGTDIIAQLLNKYFGISMGIPSLVFNSVLFFIFAFSDGIDIAVLTLATTVIATLANNYVCGGIDKRRAIYIITDQEEVMAHAIMTQVARGVTVLDVRGAYTAEKHAMLYCVISSWQVPKIRRIVRETDPRAFMTVTETIGVYGNGRGFQRINQ